MKHKAVILGCNYYIGLSTIRCLGQYGIHTVAVDYASKQAYGAKSKFCSEQLIAPHYKEDKEGFVRFLIDYASKQSHPPVLIPCHDSYVEIVDEHLTELKRYYLIPQTEQGLYTKVMDKGTLHLLATQNNVRVPETVKLNEEHFFEKIENIIHYPCIVKPVDSPAFVARFRRKLFKVHNKEELTRALDEAEQAGLEVIVQRIIPGFDDHMHTFDAYLNQQSRVTHWVSCRKLRQYPVNFGASVYTEYKKVPELYEIGARFLEQIGWKGFAEIEFKKDAESGQFYLIEINVRITNLNVLLHKAGMNIPYLTYCELTGTEVRQPAEIKATKRVFWYAYEDLLAIRDYWRTGQLTRAQVIRSLLFRPKAYAIWDWKDPQPALAYMGILLGKFLRKARKD
ncbi:carboxylate--amine ligase [Paenibacillus sp. NPDC058174]|uniref:carboxylate--amine ligase n=1 Tax=Paenibacillus sp. NPDC058174 TaxID=3346366 RepID=UPI0036D86065